MDISFSVRFLFVCFFVCTVTDFSGQDIASGANFAQRFIGVLSRESPILGTLLLQKPNIGLISHPSGSKVLGGKSYRNRHATDVPFMKSCGVWI